LARVWELPGGYVDPDEDPAVTAAREVEEETGWRPLDVEPLGSLQPMVGSADAENLLYVARRSEYVGEPTDINEAERVAWIPLNSVRERIAKGEIVGAASQVGLLHVLAHSLVESPTRATGDSPVTSQHVPGTRDRRVHHRQ
jgi:8-oxo-dGTP pyrophosphatase MutT (NUDIX family)